MDLKQIEALVKVEELKSFSKAAKSLSLTQPAVSMQIKALEDELGEILIDRGHKSVRLTAQGEAVLEFGKKVLGLNNELRRSLESMGKGETGSIAIGASTIPGAYILPRLIRVFKDEHPSINVNLTVSDTSKVLESVLSGQVDLGFVGAVKPNNRLLYKPFYKDEIILAVSGNHAWASKKKVGLDELFNEPFITREQGSGTRAVIEAKFRECGYSYHDLKITAEMDSIEAVKGAVIQGLGISLLSQLAVERELALGILAGPRIRDLALLRDLYCVCRARSNPSRVVKLFMESIECPPC